MMASNRIESDFINTHYKGKLITILSFSSRALEEAEKLRKHGIQVIIGHRLDYDLTDWDGKGFETYSIWEAVERGEIIQIW